MSDEKDRPGATEGRVVETGQLPSGTLYEVVERPMTAEDRKWLSDPAGDR